MTNEEIHRYVIEKIRLARISKGLSQLEVCTRGNFSQSFYTPRGIRQKPAVAYDHNQNRRGS